MKLGEVIPFVTIVALGEVYNVFIQWMNDTPNPNLCRVLNRKVQFILSNAFSASNDTIMVVSCFFCDIVIKLKGFGMLSEACLFLIKPDWSEWISSGVTVCILVAIAFVMIFRSVLISERGR